MPDPLDPSLGAERADVLVVGASGLVGRLLLARFGARATGTCNVHPSPGLVALDITDAQATRAVVASLAPRVVVHTAALTDVNRCEVDPEASRLVNVEGTRNVAAAAREAGARYVFFSTDYVFGDGGPHAPGAVRAPLNVYGRHKAEAEDIAAGVEDHAIIRACNVYGWQEGGKNFVMAVVEAMEAGRHVRAAFDQWVSPTLAADLAEATARLAFGEPGGDLRGVVHLAGPDHVTRLEWTLRAAKAFGLDPGLVDSVSVDSLGAAAPRPRSGGLDARASEAALGLRMRGLDEGLAAMRRDRDAARASR